MNKRYKQFWATIGGVGFLAVFFESFPSLLKSVDYFLQSRQLTIGAILMGSVPFFVVLSTIRKESEKRKRTLQIETTQQRMERNQKKIMDHWGIEGEWSSPLSGSENTLTHTSITLYTYSQKVKNRLNRRRKNMLLALKNPWSKKLFAFIVLVMLNGLNDTLQLHLSPQTINNITTLGTTYIVSQAGVDALKPVILLILSKFNVKTFVGASSNVTLTGGTYAKPPIDASADK